MFKGSWLKNYFFKSSFFKIAVYARLLFFSRYFKCARRSATIPRRPRRECKSFGCFFKCAARSSIFRDKRPICTSGEPVSVSCRAVFLMTFCFFRCVSISYIVAHFFIIASYTFTEYCLQQQFHIIREKSKIASSDNDYRSTGDKMNDPSWDDGS